MSNNLDEDQIELKTMIKELTKELKTMEEKLYQTQNESRQDPLNFPIRLNNKIGYLGSLIGTGESRPTQQALDVFNEISAAISMELKHLELLKTEKIKALNMAINESKIDIIKINK